MATSQPKRLEDIMNNHLKVYKSTNMKSNKKDPITVNLSNNPDLTRNSSGIQGTLTQESINSISSRNNL